MSHVTHVNVNASHHTWHDFRLKNVIHSRIWFICGWKRYGVTFFSVFTFTHESHSSVYSTRELVLANSSMNSGWSGARNLHDAASVTSNLLWGGETHNFHARKQQTQTYTKSFQQSYYTISYEVITATSIKFKRTNLHVLHIRTHTQPANKGSSFFETPILCPNIRVISLRFSLSTLTTSHPFDTPFGTSTWLLYFFLT